MSLTYVSRLWSANQSRAAAGVSGAPSWVSPRLDDDFASVREACRALSEDLGSDRRLYSVSTLGPLREMLSGLDRRREGA